MSACIIALSLGFLALGLGMNEDLACDRQLVNNEAAVQATLLDYGDDGTNPFVRHETTVVPLAYPLRDPGSHEPGETIAVLVDPLDPTRRIPPKSPKDREHWTWCWTPCPWSLPGFLPLRVLVRR